MSLKTLDAKRAAPLDGSNVAAPVLLDVLLIAVVMALTPWLRTMLFLLTN
jgi:hypothetical protein